MTRRSRYAPLLAAVALAALCPPATADELAADRMNVLFITADDLGLQLSCYGDTVIATPNLDRLAREGARFEVAYVAQASCSPSRSAMFTGLFPHTNGQLGLTGKPNNQSGYQLHARYRDRTIPNLLKAAGYHTGIIGKLHVAPEPSFQFDERPRVNMRDVRAIADTAFTFLDGDGGDDAVLPDGQLHRPARGATSSKQSSDWHFPAQVDGVPVDPLQPGDAPAWPFQGIDDPPQLERVANYYNCVKRFDAGVGLLLHALERAGHADDTLVILVGDHGPPFARGKTTCYEAGLRVPFLVRWPGVSRPLVSQAMVSTVDILPTILDATGVDAPDDLHGQSLRGVVRDPDAPWRTYLAGEFHCHGPKPFYPRRAIRDNRYKLIHNLRAGEAKPSTGIDGDRAYPLSQRPRYDGTDVRQAFDTFADPPEFELYDLEADPWEFHNLAGTPEVAEAERRMKDALLTWRRETDDPFLDPDLPARPSRNGAGTP